jgi:ABC-2 type transport system ATP-binding protein
VAEADPQVEDVVVFGDRFHLRVAPGAAEAVLARLPGALAAAGATVERLRPVAPALEDIFISLLQRPAPEPVK